MPKIGILDQLTDPQQAQLLTWLETIGETTVGVFFENGCKLVFRLGRPLKK